MHGFLLYGFYLFALWLLVPLLRFRIRAVEKAAQRIRPEYQPGFPRMHLGFIFGISMRGPRPLCLSQDTRVLVSYHRTSFRGLGHRMYMFFVQLFCTLNPGFFIYLLGSFHPGFLIGMILLCMAIWTISRFALKLHASPSAWLDWLERYREIHSEYLRKGLVVETSYGNFEPTEAYFKSSEHKELAGFLNRYNGSSGSSGNISVSSSSTSSGSSSSSSSSSSGGGSSGGGGSSSSW